MDNNKIELRPASAISAGKRLKETREKKSLSLDQVYKQTKIHSSVVTALEEGRAGELLTETYIRSFLRKYAQFLGLNGADIVKEYFTSYREAAAEKLPMRESALPKEATIPPKFLYAATAAIIGIILLFFAVFLVGKIASVLKEKKFLRATKPAAAAKAKPSKGKAIPAGKTTHTKKAAQPSGDIVPRTSPLILVIKVKEPVLVKVKKDGIILFSRVLPRGLTETISAKDRIELDIGRAKALELTLNGRPIALPAKSSIFGLDITRKGVRLK